MHDDKQMDLTLEEDLLDFKDIMEDPVVAAQQRARKDTMSILQEAYLRTINGYMTNGNMPRKAWDTLPRKLKSMYKARFLGTAGHCRGIPMTEVQFKAQATNAKAQKKKAKKAKQARKVNRK